ncbi:helix-hairpin-helix domain-containing protein [Brevibacterium paucivorans]|uniref:Competence protein ComEA n=1 Tax=Brevibacterium paucivorans TaxID=170994 RepID=A0A2N6VR43_9MICO|nr:helix-hairpin-helix domain-containing protein [Brevibacterium paucivorans]PMD06518.1 competence protein ComEA [Brevibacterium paucivorans]
MSASPDDRFAGLVGASSRGWKPEDNLDDLVPGNRPVPTRVVIVAVAAVVVVAVVGLIIFTALKQSSEPAGEAAGAAEPGPPVATGGGSPETSPTSDVTVHVAGEVKKPGVLTLPAGSRITDAVQAAGGLTQDADPSALNLAQPLNDGEQIKVPKVGEPEESGEAPGTTSGASGKTSSGSTGGGKINVNTASEKELQELPGVGPATSAAMVKHREENGRFESVEQLEDVPGIGPAILERLTPLVTV